MKTMSTSADTKKKDTKDEKKAAHPPFDGKDFEVWFERMKLKLERIGVWKYCEKDIEELEESKQDEHDKWKKDSARVKELLYDGMTDKIMKTVKFEPTAFRVVVVVLIVAVVVAVEDVAEGIVLVVVVAEEAAKELDVVTEDKVPVEEGAFIVESNRTKCWTART
ncbi:hypothetical protein PHYSODRAFT_247224 [Phytophthora sojae]|uniref:DUF4219 domain-containing protein n=1 Tax=Phytophthora sojae (strain P6497) TaxID=1094619 RepID=G5AGV7_PHYSP|nr:hypothetical protein PHYSODRAFT_247224 [Phytophthora sojae]EGZ05150.1 hypothetical protein PHYSODRAFT_247224 [Phytophthora sojae]|eukprot:XP_009539308.1 hypothetical protein PHYSODRAFT_247224 [Phytophthora sojae]